MTGAALQTLNTAFLGGKAIDSDLFYQLVNAAKNSREMIRDWMVLRSLDTSIVFSGSDTYLTAKNLPTRFLRTYTSFDRDIGLPDGVFLVTTAGEQLYLKPIRQADAYKYRNQEGYYYVDMKNRTISRTGSTAGTLYLNYLQGTSDIDANSTTIWSLPSYADPILAYDVAMQFKGGIDWDTVNASQVPYNQRALDALWMKACTWDSQLQQAELGV